MLFKRFLYYLYGYIRLEVEGYYIERFLNKCTTEEIKIWDIKRDGECLLNVSIDIKDYKRLKKILKITKCSAKIKYKKGVPFKIHKYRKRKIFIILPIIILIILYIISNFVWNIDVIGNENIDSKEILEIAYNNGLNIGMLKKDISTDEIINQIRLQRDDISWVGIKIEGTNVIIEISEAVEKPEILDKDEYCNIVADKDAIIESINVENGTACVEVGDVVKEGDILVEGVMRGNYTDDRKVHASANITAKVWFSESKKAYKNQEISLETGNEESYYELSINNLKINFNKSLSKFENYDTIKNSNRLKIFNNFYLPITITKVTNIEMKSENVTYSEEELKENTVLELENLLKEEIAEKEIIDENILTEDYDDFIEVKVIYEVLETIGVEEKLE